MRIKLLLLFLIVCVVVIIVAIRIVFKTLLAKILTVLAMFFVFYFGSTLINLNTLEPKIEEKVENIAERYGKENIYVSGSTIYVKIKGKWVNSKNIEVPDSFSKTYTISYDGVDIELNSPEIRSVLSSLEDIGLTK